MSTEILMGKSEVLADLHALIECVLEGDPDVIEVAFPYDEPAPRPDFYVHREGNGAHNAVFMTEAPDFDTAITRATEANCPNCVKVIACPDFVLREQLNKVPSGVEVWGPMWFFDRFWTRIATPVRALKPLSAAARIHRGVGISLRSLLTELLTGKKGGLDGAYEELIRDVFQYLFYPDLNFARRNFRNAAGDREVDLLFYNDSRDQYTWGRFRNGQYGEDFVVIECKNRKDGLKKEHASQLATYLDGSGFSRVGVLVGRRAKTQSVRDELMHLRHRSPRPTIFVLTDEEILPLLDARHWPGMQFDVRVQNWIMRFLG